MLILFLSFFGLFIGSFLGVVVDRFGTKQSVFVGRSECEHCHVALKVIDLVPVASFILLHGKCRHCHAKISWKYPLMECITAILFGLTAWRYTIPMLLPVGFVPVHLDLFLFRDLLFVSLLLILFLIDARHGVLPDVFTLPGIVLITAMNIWLGIPLMTLVVGGLVVGGFFALQYFVSRGTWVGGGDIRLGVLLGVMFGLSQGVLSLMIAYIIGAAFALVLIWRKKAAMKSTLSFGPFLAIAGWIVLIFGPYISQYYLPF